VASKELLTASGFKRITLVILLKPLAVSNSFEAMAVSNSFEAAGC
jgi:hypothetical protein